MAASDPTSSVPTPTGTLQGVAAFSWSGSAWTPAGSAMPSVATPTGVLRGVAPFTYSGGVWTPTGLAMPSVATPTGVLDGVALYTWSGSAWTPTPTGSDAATPTGTLRGIAAFYWDGTNWQPAGQAAPEVPTPGGVLQGVAMFSWSGSAWLAASSGPPGVTLDLNFTTMATLNPSVTFSRTSTATDSIFTDAAGSSFNSYATGQPRLTPNGLLLEETRTNYLLNSGAPATQTTGSLATGSYTLWVIGTGSASVAAGTAVITNAGAATPGTPRTISVTTAGTVTVTVTGALNRFQLEGGAFPTSFIPTAAATAQRGVDIAQIASAAIPSRNGPAETFAAEILPVSAQQANPRIFGVSATQNAPLVADGSHAGRMNDGVGQVITANTFAIGSVAKLCTTWTSGAATACLNAGAVASSAALTAGFASVTQFRFMGDSNSAGDCCNGYMRRFRYWPRVLTNAEMQQVTT